MLKSAWCLCYFYRTIEISRRTAFIPEDPVVVLTAADVTEYPERQNEGKPICWMLHMEICIT